MFFLHMLHFSCVSGLCKVYLYKTIESSISPDYTKATFDINNCNAACMEYRCLVFTYSSDGLCKTYTTVVAGPEFSSSTTIIVKTDSTDGCTDWSLI